MQNQPDLQPPLGIPSVTDEVPLQEDNVELHFCNKFSIRYYVFASRQKDIKKNWPFRRECLQVCMKHGIKNLLPPFESPGFVRHKSCDEDVDLDSVEEEKLRPNSCQNYSAETDVVEENIKFTNDLYIEEVVSEQVGLLSLSGEDKDNENDKNTAETKSKFNEGSFRNLADEVLENCPLVLGSESRSELLKGVDGLMVNGKETVQGCYVANKNPFSENKLESGQIRDTANCVISDPIPSVRRQRNKLNKHKRKRRKKRSMVDICAEARPCTLEELDRINGSNWAMDSTVMPYGDLNCHEALVSEGNGNKLDVDLSTTKLQIMPGLETCNYKSKLVNGFLQMKQLRDDHKDESSLLGKRRRIPVTSSKGCKFKSRNSSFIIKET